MDFPGNNSRLIHSENIYYVPGNVLSAEATKNEWMNEWIKERKKRMRSLPSRTWGSQGGAWAPAASGKSGNTWGQARPVFDKPRNTIPSERWWERLAPVTPLLCPTPPSVRVPQVNRKPVTPAVCPSAMLVCEETLWGTSTARWMWKSCGSGPSWGPIGSWELLRGALWRLLCHHPSLKGLITQASPSLEIYCLGPRLERHFLTGHQHGHSLWLYTCGIMWLVCLSWTAVKSINTRVMSTFTNLWIPSTYTVPST